MEKIELLTDNKKKIKSVYISGPITKNPKGNARAFQEATDKIRELGFEVVSPSELDEEADLLTEELAKVNSGSKEWAQLLVRDILHVTAVDALVVIDGWQASRGAKLEVLLANSLKKKVFNYSTLEVIPEEELPASEREGTLLELAISRAGAETVERHGHPYEAFTRDSQVVSALLGKDITPEEIPLIMMGLKLSRYAHNPSEGRGSLIDVAGYAATIEMLAERLGGWGKLQRKQSD